MIVINALMIASNKYNKISEKPDVSDIPWGYLST